MKTDGRETSDMAWRSVSTMMAGLLLYGGLGWLVGAKFGHQDVFTAVGSLVGIALSLYVTIVRIGGGSK
jgi:hypothetical protein